MLWSATAVAIAAIAAAPAPKQLVLAPRDVPGGYHLIASASGPTAPNAYRVAYAGGSTLRMSSVAVVFADERGAATMVAAPSSSCGTSGSTRKLPVGAPLGTDAVLCRSSAHGYDAYAVVWRDGRVFATLALIGRHREVSAGLALRLARLQEARIRQARAAGPAA